MVTLQTQHLIRNDTTANWALFNPILGKGELAIEWIGSNAKIKIGDGQTHWADLPYFLNEVLVEGNGDIVTDVILREGAVILLKDKSITDTISGSNDLSTDKAVKDYADKIAKHTVEKFEYVNGQGTQLTLKDGTVITVPNYAYTQTESDNKYAEKTNLEITQNDLEEVKTSYLKSATYDSSTGELSFVLQDNSTTAFNLANMGEIELIKNNLQTQTNRIQELEDKQIDTVFTKEEIMIDSSQWSVIDGYAEPYLYYTIVQLENLTLESESVELINNQPILFAKYGFVIATIREGTKVEIYALELPTDMVTLVFEVRNLVPLYGENNDNN